MTQQQGVNLQLILGSGEYTIYKSSLNLLRNNFKELIEQKQGRFQALDGLRAIAIIQVVLFHCVYLNFSTIPESKRDELFILMYPWLNWIWQGDKGVDLFFVLSGFLITMLLLREHRIKNQVNKLDFFRRRAGRILPAYFLLLITGWLMDQPNQEWLWSNLLFINNLVSPDAIYLPWSWSITVEVQFYLLFPILVLPGIIYSRRPLTAALLLIILAITARQIVIYNNFDLITTPFYEQLYNPEAFTTWWRALYIQLYTRAGPITFGIAAAVIYTFYDKELSGFIETHPLLTKGVIILALLISILSHSVPYHDPSRNYLETIGITGNYWLLGQHRNLYALCSAVIILFVLKPRPYYRAIHNFLSNRVLGFIATISYSAYLFHILLLNTVFGYLRTTLPDHIGEPAWLILGAVLTIIVTMAVASVIYVLLEKPFIDLTHTGRQRRTGKQV